jgi:general secretion pathway protein A
VVAHFKMPADPPRLWLRGPYGETLTALQAAVRDREGIVILTGEAGTGKTTLTTALLDSLRDDEALAEALLYPSPVIETTSLFEFVAVLRRRAPRHKRLLLVIDEAQNLTPGVFRDVAPVLWETASGDRSPFTLLLAGRDGFEPTVLDERLAQKVTARFRLRPLTEDEAVDYVAHQLAVACVSPRHLTPEAVHAILRISGGVPRLIDMMCEDVLTAHRHNLGTIGRFTRWVFVVLLRDRLAGLWLLPAQPFL